MYTGKLKNRISILRPPDPEVDVDEAGQPLDEWIPVADTWAAIIPLRGRELESARQISGEVTTRIEIRYREGINRTMKAVFDSVEFEFLYIIHVDYAKKELHILAKERQ